MDEVRIITTSDGSHSLLNTALNETYHSIHGAIQESRHVFIVHGLEEWLSKSRSSEAKILEIGFGTGLNAFISALESSARNLKVYYESWEAFPLDDLVIHQLNYPGILGSKALFNDIHAAPWNQPTKVAQEFTLRKTKANLLNDSPGDSMKFDIIFFDAFAPARQPEMWSAEVLKKVVDALAPGGIWVTYCAKGQVKRDLRALGLNVETLPGPPGKKEMIRASRIN
jgi:tRNA U34 5-methylaminomethyl-2-thiouridine-forming methyltransferase MnmC